MSELWDKVEMFNWNGAFSIRDAKTKKTLFLIDLPSREYFKVNLFLQKQLPKIVELMNGYAMAQEVLDMPQSTPEAEGLPVVASNGNGHTKLSQSERMKEYWRKRREEK